MAPLFVERGGANGWCQRWDEEKVLYILFFLLEGDHMTGFDIFIDAEWGSDNTPISLQILLDFPGMRPRKIVLLSHQYESVFNLAKESYPEDVDILFHSFEDSIDSIRR